MKRLSLLLVALLMGFILLCFSCTELLSQKEPSLQVRLPGGRFVVDTENVTIEYYKVGIYNNKGYSDSKKGKPGETVAFYGLPIGNYFVYIESYDDKGECVAYANQTAEVKPKIPADVSLDLTWNKLTEAAIKKGTVSFEVTPPKKTTYVYGEVFDPTGLKVVAVFDNGYREEIPAMIQNDGDETSQSIYYEISSSTLDLDEDGNYKIISGEATSVNILITWGTNTEGLDDDGEYEIETAFTLTVKPLVPEMVFVPGGTVTGADYTNNYTGVFIEGRTVTLSDFYMGKYEVTQEEYASVMANQKVTVGGTEYTLESNPNFCTKDSTSYTLFSGDEQEKRPVEGVSWYDAVWYCNALSEKEGLTKAYNIVVTQVQQESGKTGHSIYEANVTLNKNATGYRLPTEAEWEYAARGGDPTAEDWNYVFSGADTAKDASYSSPTNSGLDSVGWYSYNNKSGTTQSSIETEVVSGRGTHQVGKKAANKLGLYDMSGNVYEWCYDRNETVNTGEESDPTGAASGDYRVYRGGSWSGNAFYVSVSLRRNYYPDDRCNNLGFRVVRSAN